MRINHLNRERDTRGEVVDNVDAMQEIFKHLDAQALAVASCVNRRWYEAAMDDKLWEVICTQHLPATGISIGKLRLVVNVLGGFRHLYVRWLRPLQSNAASSADCSKSSSKKKNVVWSEDHVRLSLSLFSVEYFERLGPNSRSGSCNISDPILLKKVQQGLHIPIQRSSSTRNS